MRQLINTHNNNKERNRDNTQQRNVTGQRPIIRDMLIIKHNNTSQEETHDNTKDTHNQTTYEHTPC